MGKKLKRGSAIIVIVAFLGALALAGLGGAGNGGTKSAASWVEQDASWGE